MSKIVFCDDLSILYEFLILFYRYQVEHNHEIEYATFLTLYAYNRLDRYIEIQFFLDILFKI